MTVGRILDRTWAILRGHAKLFFKLGVPPTVATLVLYGVVFGCFAAAGMFHMPLQAADPKRVLWIVFPATLMVAVPGMVVFAVYQGATCRAAIEANHGTVSTWSDLYRSAWSRAGRYTWLIFLCWLLLMAPFLLGMTLIAVAGTSLGGGGSDANPGAWFVLIPLVILLYVGGAVYMVWMLLRLGLAFPAAVAEDLTAWEAVQRSSRLTVKAKGRIFLVLLLLWAIAYAVLLVFELVGMVGVGVLMLIGSALHMQIEQPVSIAVVAAVALVFTTAILLFSMLSWAAYAIGLSVIYEDQVMRIDGPQMSAAGFGGEAG